MVKANFLEEKKRRGRSHGFPNITLNFLYLTKLH